MKMCEWCNREFKHQGALNLHKSLHCKSKPGKVTEETKKDQVTCEHDFRFLNQSGGELRAIKSGYSEVCIKCQTLRA